MTDSSEGNFTPRVFGVVGWKNSGKTTLVVKLVEYFTSLGVRIGTIKHAHHEFDVDIPGTDSFRHRQAGASGVIIASHRRWALMRELKDEVEPTLDELVAKLPDFDLILVEGFKFSNHHKLQAVRLGVSDSAMSEVSNILALACDEAIESDELGLKCPVLNLNDVGGIARFIAQTVELDLPE